MRAWIAGLWVVVVCVPGVSASEVHTVKMAGMAYSPANISAHVGDTIRFINDDTLDHDVFVPTAGFSVDLGTQKPGVETVMALGKAGAFDVECVIHEHMNLKVEVLR